MCSPASELPAARPGITIKIDWRYSIAFYFVVMFYASAHELVHHFVARAACGSWGTKTFNSFHATCEGTFGSYMSTLAGPIYTFACMYFGWWLLKSARSSPLRRQLGFAIIFAQLPLQRITGPLLGYNDEFYVTRHYFGNTAETRWLTFAAILLICLPPLIGAFRAIDNRWRMTWFLFYLCLFPALIWGPVFMGLEYLLLTQHVLNGQWIGIAHLFIVNEVVTVIGYYSTRLWLLVPRQPTQRTNHPDVAPARQIPAAFRSLPYEPIRSAGAVALKLAATSPRVGSPVSELRLRIHLRPRSPRRAPVPGLRPTPHR